MWAVLSAAGVEMGWVAGILCLLLTVGGVHLVVAGARLAAKWGTAWAVWVCAGMRTGVWTRSWRGQGEALLLDWGARAAAAAAAEMGMAAAAAAAVMGGNVAEEGRGDGEEHVRESRHGLCPHPDRAPVGVAWVADHAEGKDAGVVRAVET